MVTRGVAFNMLPLAADSPSISTDLAKCCSFFQVVKAKSWWEPPSSSYSPFWKEIKCKILLLLEYLFTCGILILSIIIAFLFRHVSLGEIFFSSLDLFGARMRYLVLLTVNLSIFTMLIICSLITSSLPTFGVVIEVVFGLGLFDYHWNNEQNQILWVSDVQSETEPRTKKPKHVLSLVVPILNTDLANYDKISWIPILTHQNFY